MKKCRRCREEFIRFVEQKSYYSYKKPAKDNSHFHYGICYYKYGLCINRHYTPLHKTKVIWDSCIRCGYSGTTKFHLKKKSKKKVVEEEEKSVCEPRPDEIQSLRVELRQFRKELEEYKRIRKEELISALFDKTGDRKESERSHSL